MSTKRKKSTGNSGAVMKLVIALIVAVLGAFGIRFGDDITTFFQDGARSYTQVDGTIEVHYIDVGQGDAELIIADDGSAMLIDAGTNSGESELLIYLQNVGVKKLKYAVFTHPHEDHIGGADYILNNIETENVIITETKAETKTYERMLTAIDGCGAKVIIAKAGNSYTLGSATFKLLGPAAEYTDLNNTSIVLRLDYGQTSFMMTGDAESLSEGDMLNKWGTGEFKCDVLKVGHHGSSSSTSEDFLKACSPSVAVISCATGNDYGHPHRETLTILDKYSIETHRTDKESTIVVVSDGNSVSVK